MKQSIVGMMVVCTFHAVVQMLREPEKFDEHTRHSTAKMLEGWKDAMQKELTGQLMSEAIRDVPEAQSEGGNR